MALRLQGEIPVAGDVAGGCDAAVLQRRRTVRAIMPPERRQAVARLREGVGIGLDHEHGLAIAHRQAVAAVGGGLDDGLAVGDLHPGQARIGRAPARLAVALQIDLAADHGIRGPGRRSQQQAAQPGGRQFHGTVRERRRPPIVVSVDDIAHAWRIAGANQRVGEVPPQLQVQFEGAAQLATAPGQGVIEFHPDGGSSGGRIRLQRDAAEWRIDVGWLTGEVRSGPWREQ
ncbi:hypothetical protein G6F59_014408 [Rhizopus arrhizus]|nr:hypothetical protein G6F59_014408 [Rhizopus arrhizus]